MPQDCLYTLVELGAEARLHAIGALRELWVAPADRDAVLARLVSPDTRLVTLTVTEKGYCLDADVRLDESHPDIARDLASPRMPCSVIGRLALGLRERRVRGLPPLTGDKRFVFPGDRSRDRPMSNNTVNAALRRLGYSSEQMTGHGFCSMASTLLNEQGWHPDAIERQLAHQEPNEIRAAYNYAKHLPERRKMMQAWSDYLDRLRSAAAAIPPKSGELVRERRFKTPTASPRNA